MVFLFIKPFKVEDLLKFNFRLAFWNGLSVFLFILFFQPFGISELELHNAIFFIAGFGLYMFLVTVLCLVVIPAVLPKWFRPGTWDRGPSDFLNIMIWAFCSVGFCFYLRYVGKSSLPLKIIIRIVLTCLSPVVLIKLLYYIRYLNRRLELPKTDVSSEDIVADKSETPKDLTFLSENGAEVITMSSDDFLMISSADNYVEIIYREGRETVSRLLRTSIKGVLEQDIPAQFLLRCHRAHLINPVQVLSMVHEGNGYRLNLRYLPDTVPVSRGYQLHVRDVLGFPGE